MRTARALTLASALAAVVLPSAIACTSSPHERAAATSDFALSLGNGALSMAVGESITLHASPVAADGTPFAGLYTLAWTSSSAAVVAVATDGTLTAQAAGTATITATATRIDTGAVATAAVAVTVGGGSPPPPPPPPPPPGGSTLRPDISGLCLTAAAAIADGTRIMQADCAAAPLGFTETADAVGTELRVAGTSFCVDLPNGSASDGDLLQLFHCDGSSDQRFSPIAYANARRGFRSVTSGKCFDIQGATAASGALVQQWSCDDVPEQRFSAASSGGGGDAGADAAAGDGGTISPAMWNEIDTQRAAFGDPNDCKARVDAAVPTGTVLAPGGDIAAALATSSTVVLQTGTYRPTGTLLAIPTGKTLIAGDGQKPVLDLSALTNFGAIYMGDDAVLAGIDIKGAQGISIVTFDTGKGRYSNGGLVYNLAVHDSGLTGNMDDGTGIAISGGGNAGQGQNWCVVAVEIYNSWNPAGASPVGNGGNSDGISSKFGAGETTFIGVNSHNNGDDEVDMWQGGATYHYFSSYHDGGKVPNVTNGGDGNGVKLGVGTVAHKFYKTTANDNRTGGFNLNGNTMQPVLVQSSASGNGTGDYINGVNAP
jgi:pectate disaccharide-lyase